MDIAVLADNRVKLKEGKKKDKYIDLTREQKKTMEPESSNYTKEFILKERNLIHFY